MTSTPSYFTIPLALKIELQKDAWLLWTSALELFSSSFHFYISMMPPTFELNYQNCHNLFYVIFAH